MVDKMKLMSEIGAINDISRVVCLLAKENELTITEMIHMLKECSFSKEEIAVQLKKVFEERQRELLAIELAEGLLSGENFPDISKEEMKLILEKCQYDASQVRQAIKMLYPIRIQVEGNKSWQDTGIILKQDEKATIKYISGRWYISPAAWGCDAEGGWQASNRRGYPMPSMREGALIGRVGEQIFYVGRHGETPKGVEGKLELVTNDDLEGWYGAGLTDNVGSLEVEIRVSSR